MSLGSLNLRSLRAAYASGACTPSGVVAEVYRRIEQHADPAIWIHLLPVETALEHARRVEAKPLEAQPLYGVPFAIKDNIDLAGTPTTAACAEFAYVPSGSAPVVQKLIAAGAIPIGKTNLDQFATGLTGVRSPYGVPRNPFRSDVIPGGSSSGSAVAVAAGLVSFALGTDTAGSGRVPAGLNNIVGLKPSRGALSARGVVPACRTLDCVSIFALTASDAAAIQQIAEGYDPDDPFSRRRPPALRAAEPESLRIGIPRREDLTFCGDAEAEACFAAAVRRLPLLGHSVVEIDFSAFRAAAELLYQGPWVAERWAALRRFHGAHAGAFLPITRQIIEGASQLSAADAFAGIYQLASVARDAEREWEKMDVLLVPTAPRPRLVAEIAAEPLRYNSELGAYTNFVNLLDLAAIAAPAGMRSDGVPHGVTFISRAWQEPLLLGLAERWQARAGGQLGATASTFDMIPPAQAPSPSPAPAQPNDAIKLAVVGAHLSGMPLNHQLTDLSGKLVWTGRTAPTYRLYALSGAQPPKPGLKRVTQDGAAIALEVWELSAAAFGRFVAAVPAPLCIGTVELENGDKVKGFLCEPAGLLDAIDITPFGGWRAYLASKTTAGVK